MVALLALVGVVIDLGNVFTAKRALQGVTDIAAIAASSDLGNAVAAADANAVLAAYNASEVTEVTLGSYTRDASIPVANRFQASAPASANAVRVTMTHQQKLLFLNMFGASTSTRITAQAIAVQTRVVSFDIGSGVASLNGGVANAVLGAAIGGNVSLSAVDYNALASAQVSLFGLANAISLQLGQTSASYGQAVSGTISWANFLAALERIEPGLEPQLQALADAAATGAGTVDLSRLLDFGPYSTQLVGDAVPQVTASTNVLALLQGASQVGGAPHTVSLALTPRIQGIASVTALMTIGEPPVGTTVMGVDAIGTTLHTAQIRLYLDVALATLVSGGVVHLPLYVEVGYGSATLAALSCNALDSSATQVTLNVTPGLVNGWIGSVTAADMSNYAAEPTPGTATLLNLLGIATVTGRANAQIGNTVAVAAVFSNDDIQTQAVKTTSTTDFAGALIASLVGKLQLQVNVLGLPLLVPPGLTGSVSAVLTAAVSPVDQLLSSVLQAAGLNLGSASTWVSGAKCTAAALTN